MPLVKVTYGEEVFEVKADTIKELKKKISKELSKDQEENYIEVGECWRLYQFGFVLPNAPETKLKIFEDDGKIHLNLVEPKRLPRGQPRTIKNQTDKTRFIVRGTRDHFEILEIKSRRIIKPTLKSNFLAKEKFGVVTNIIGEEPGKRSVQFDVYEVNRNGYVVLQESEVDDSDFSVCLVPKNSSVPSTDGVRWTNTKTYLEDHIITPRERRELLFSAFSAVLQAGSAVATAGISTAFAGNAF